MDTLKRTKIPDISKDNQEDVESRCQQTIILIDKELKKLTGVINSVHEAQNNMDLIQVSKEESVNKMDEKYKIISELIQAQAMVKKLEACKELLVSVVRTIADQQAGIQLKRKIIDDFRLQLDSAQTNSLEVYNGQEKQAFITVVQEISKTFNHVTNLWLKN